MSLAVFKAEEMEEWRDDAITRALLKQLRGDQAALATRLEEMGASGDAPFRTAATAGAAAELRRVLTIIETRGK